MEVGLAHAGGVVLSEQPHHLREQSPALRNRGGVEDLAERRGSGDALQHEQSVPFIIAAIVEYGRRSDAGTRKRGESGRLTACMYGAATWVEILLDDHLLTVTPTREYRAFAGQLAQRRRAHDVTAVREGESPRISHARTPRAHRVAARGARNSANDRAHGG